MPVLLLFVTPAAAQPLPSVPAGFTASNYATGLPGTLPVTNLAINTSGAGDPNSHTIYYTDADINGVLRRIDPTTKAVTTVTPSFRTPATSSPTWGRTCTTAKGRST